MTRVKSFGRRVAVRPTVAVEVEGVDMVLTKWCEDSGWWWVVLETI